ncbi:MAG: phosphatidate cytidylyltransferase [Candidatus Omnitrophota bacterium]|jgi:phosphatidate cytidylyltransferase
MNTQSELGISENKFVQRTVITLLLIAFTVLLVYLFPDWLYCAVVVFFVAMGMLEFFRMVERKGIFVYKYFGTIAGSLIPVAVYMGNGFPGLENLEPLFIVIACLIAFTLQFTRRDNARDHLVSMSITLFALFYIGWFSSFIMKIKMLDNGANLVFFLVLVTKSADIGAYLVGRKLGKNELLPRISPKKTREGALGGVIFSVFMALVLGMFLTEFSFLHLIVLGVVVAALGQVGDLAESLIKRDCNVKDSGSYLAGIGGAFDVIDSLLFTTPVFYFYVKTF